MRRQIKTINRLRPKFVVGIGTFGAEVRKIITKTSETISLIMVEGKDFFDCAMQWGLRNAVEIETGPRVTIPCAQSLMTCSATVRATLCNCTPSLYEHQECWWWREPPNGIPVSVI